MVSALPEGPDWGYEIKLDGYRAQAIRDGERTRLLSRNGKDLGQRFPALVPELAKAIPHGSIVDGELVALDPSGKPSFSLIQNSATSGATFVFFAFDLLRLGGEDLTQKPLSERRALLRTSLRPTGTVQLSESFNIPAKQMLELVRSHGLEGVVAKRLSSTYEQGRRTGAWTKMRVELAQELVIGGYTPLRCCPGWLLPRRPPPLLRERSRRVRSGKPPSRSRAARTSRRQRLPLRQSAGSQRRTMGSGADSSKDEGLQLAPP